MLLIVFPQKSKGQDLDLCSVCGFSLVPSMYLLFTSFYAKLHVHAVQIWTREGRQRFACESLKELTSYMSGICTLPDQLHISYTDVCPKTPSYQAQATVFTSWRTADCDVAAFPSSSRHKICSLFLLINPYPTAFPYGNGMVLHFYQQQESSTTKTVHKVINKRLKTYV